MLELITINPKNVLKYQKREKTGVMTKKTNGRKIYPVLADRNPLPEITFQTVQERNRYVLEKRSEGYTLQSIASSVSLTREMIRQIVKRHNGPTTSNVRRERIKSQQKEVAQALTELKAINVDEIADHLHQDPTRIRKLLGKKSKKLQMGRTNFSRIYSDEDLLNILRQTSARLEGPLTVKKYRDLGVQPTIPIYLTHFGTWNNACDLAGVTHGKAIRANYVRAHSEEDMLAYVASYLADPRTSGSANG